MSREVFLLNVWYVILLPILVRHILLMLTTQRAGKLERANDQYCSNVALK